MATAATQENFADASNTAEKQNVLTEPRQNVPSISTPPQVNGEASSTDGDKTEKGLAQPTSAAASVSCGSDTEASKGENSKLRVDDKGHIRAASIVKKPTSFKAVTVNKTFLAAKGPIGLAASKLGDNKPVTGSATVQAGPSISAAPRPRLVAKTGSGLRDSAPRTSAAINGGKSGSAPDPGAVWNKNRPAPPPEVKRLTDEDLRKQYGIHLATRIQGDDQGGKQANWADIDDDEEDWAPETIEWTDGTKITLHQADETPIEQAQPKPPAAPEMSKPQSPAPPSSTTSSTVRIGGISGGSGKGLVLKGAAEKPTLVAKPPGPPTPVKSPWAPLPPTKIAPIVTEPETVQQQQPSRLQQRDSHSSESMPPPIATKEIAADDFSRGWRENPQNRELYNSQSGRYEPVTDNRRNSRIDGHSRQPALLQRPTHHEQQGPAEPSGAFQTHRTSGESTYGRRRNSSNVSGGCGNNMRRVSFNRGVEMPTSHDMTGPRRGSLAAVSDSPSSPRNISPAAPYPGQRNNPGQPWQSRASPVTSHNSPNMIHGQLTTPVQSGKPLASAEADLEYQNKVMAQKREAARKRKLEEAKTEAEKKERLRLKVESLSLLSEVDKHKKDTSAEEKPTPKQIQVRDPAEARTKVVDSELTGDVKHAGATKPEQKRPVEQEAQGSAAKDSGANQPAQPEERRNSTDRVQVPSQTNLPAQPWQNASQPNKFSGWNANAHANANRNVWGGHHGIGNGSFGLQETAGSQNGPGPIGPPGSYRQNGQQNSRGREQFGGRPGPIAPPNGQSVEPRRQATQSQAPNPWTAFSIADSDRQIAAFKAQQNAERIEREAVEGVQKPKHIDTWKQTGLDKNGERTNVKAISTLVTPATINGVPVKEMAPPTHLGTVPNGVRHDVLGGAMSNHNMASGMTTSPPQRGSRFFPSRDVRLEDTSFACGRSSSPSPPPPTMPGHPAYDGDVIKPNVSLPRPPPVVKLPPARLAPIGPPNPPPTFAAAVAGSSNRSLPSNYPRANAQPRGQNHQPGQGEQNWQDKFNDLMGRKASPPKSYALAVNSSSKYAFELLGTQTPATVTLPGSRSGGSSAYESSFATKPMSEECFEEQEMGSRPVFNPPRASLFQPLGPRPKPKEQKPKAVECLSIKPLPFSLFPVEFASGGPNITVKFGEREKKIISAPCLRQKSNPRRGGQRGGSSRGNSYTRGGRRESSGNYPSSKLDNAPSTAPNSNPSRGRGRGFGSSNWNSSRHVSTPVTSN